ncbi:MAG TPA: hypothetical protein VFX98_00635 [Longimicrobiaceae bacterium]|nr:hypothetical protein [Longimicrobiaceae bacterium]
MKAAFTLERAHVANTHWFTLKRELYDYTGSEDEASSILRGLERLGSDAGIQHYEITPTANRRVYPGAPAVVWSVRAVR